MAKSLQAKQAHDKTGHCNGASSSLGIVPIRKNDKTSHAVAKLATSNTDNMHNWTLQYSAIVELIWGHL